MRVICPACQAKAVIGKTHRLSAGVADLYCSCSDPECGHTFVSTLSFSHTLSPSARSTSRLALELIKSLPADAQRDLKNQLSLI